MSRLRHRRPQPPICPDTRPDERHAFLPGALAAVLGLALLGFGVARTTAVPVKDGGRASERQLVRAFALSGLQYEAHLPPPVPPRFDNPDTAAEELARWMEQQAAAEPTPVGWVVRVDPRAATRCPT